MKRLFLFVALQLAVVASFAQTGEVHFLSVNDIHAAVERFPQFKVIVDSLRTVHPDLLLLSGGDNRTGNPINDIHPVSCKPMVDMMNAVGFDYSAFGNHEFDGGLEDLRTVINNSNHRYLCGNVQIPDSLRIHVNPFTIVEREGLRIGIVGLIQVDPLKGIPDAHPKQVEGLKFKMINEAARDYVWMREVCDVFVLLTHNGFEADIELAKAVPEADLIIGGHSHTTLEPSHTENGVLITQAGRWLKNATLTTIKVKDGKVVEKKAELVNVDKYPKKDPKVQAALDAFNDNPTLMRVLTQVETDITEKEDLGCLMADALLAETGADIAFQNSGGVRYDNKPAGPFTVNDVYRLDPFGNEVVEFHLTGEEVEEMIAAIARAEEYGPSYVSGLTYFIHFGKGGRTDVKKVKAFTPDGKKIDPKKTYKVVTNSYAASVADFSKQDTATSLFIPAAEMLIHHLEKQTSVKYNGNKRVEIKRD